MPQVQMKWRNINLAVRIKLDVTLLDFPVALQFIHLGLGARIVARRHGQSVRKQVRHAEDQDHLGGQTRADHACNDGEGRDGTIDAAIHPVAQVVGLVFRGKARTNCLAGMFVLKLHAAGLFRFPLKFGNQIRLERRPGS